MFIDDHPNYLDRVFFKIVNKDNYKYRIYYIDHQRDEAWVNSDSFDLHSQDSDGIEYKLYIFDPSGQTIQMIGYFKDTFLEQQPPIYNEQWCDTPCPNNQLQGLFDRMREVFIEDKNDIVYQIVFGDQQLGDNNDNNNVRNGKFNKIL